MQACLRKLALRHVSPAELRSFASTSNPFSTTSWTLHAIARSNVNTISKQKRSAELEKLQKKRVVREQRRTREAQRDERRRALQDVYKQEVYDKRVHGRDLAEQIPELDEEALESIYTGLMQASPRELEVQQAIEAPETKLALDSVFDDGSQARRDRLAQLQQRLEGLSKRSEEFEVSDGALDGEDRTAGGESDALVQQSPQDLLARVIELHAHRGKDVSATVTEVVPEVEDVELPRGLLAQSEWRDLVLTCAEESSVDTVLTAIAEMDKNLPIPDDRILAAVIGSYASQGRVKDALSVASFAKEHNLPLSVSAHHQLMLALLPEHPEMAVKHLHSLEAAGHTPLMQTYTAVIQRFLSPASPAHLVSRGWDLFAHMRLVSHPVPSAELFAEMIQACARGARPSPERAIDLFTEMTVDNRLAPTELAYNGVIRACTREGSQANYFEGLRLMRQMLDENILPSRHTFHALLEGARRHGDLARARWMLVKMVDIGGDAGPDSNTLGLIFQTYAAYKPPNKVEPRRSALAESVPTDATTVATERRPTGNDPPDRAVTIGQGGSAKESRQADVSTLLVDDSLFYPGPMPQTVQEVLVESRNLMQQCVGADAMEGSDGPTRAQRQRPKSFALVRPTTFLLNSYQSVLSAHAPFNDLVSFYDQAWTRLGVERNRFSFEEAIERCETAKNRRAGLEFARRVFDDWRAWAEGRGIDDEKERISMVLKRRSGVNVSKMWASMIRNLARCFETNEAKSLLRQFVAMYPASAILDHAHARQAQSANLVRLPSPVRLSSASYPETTGRGLGLSVTRPTRDDGSPPGLTFKDVELLHLRCANIEDKDGVALVTGVCREYDRARRKAALVGLAVPDKGPRRNA